MKGMTALRIYAGPKARRHIERHGLHAGDIGVVPGAAGGPKGLVLGPLDRFIFGEWLERVVFSSPSEGATTPLPFATGDYRTRQVTLAEANFSAALQASCSIPFALKAIHDIPGAPPGAYWDGGITDYHLHLDYCAGEGRGLVLYPHFQKSVVPGWLDKSLRWRHGATHFLDTTVVLAPDPQWVSSLPGAKLPDRTDFTRFGTDLQARMTAWNAAVSASRQLADEFQAWLARPDLRRVEVL